VKASTKGLFQVWSELSGNTTFNKHFQASQLWNGSFRFTLAVSAVVPPVILGLLFPVNLRENTYSIIFERVFHFISS
jgi:hypothetical protein